MSGTPGTTMKISPSQLSTFRLCPRKWWFASVKKMRKGSSEAQVFGDVLHKVIERFLLADRLGRDPNTGKPVNLYPKGWQHMQNRWTGEQLPDKITPQQEVLVKSLISAAIEGGILIRRPDQVIEKELDIAVIPADGDLPEVRLGGFVDVDLPGEIVDHKTAGSLRYIRTANEEGPGSDRFLGHDTAMLCYARPKVPELDTVDLTHVVYLKDKNSPRVIPTTVSVTAEAILKHWETVEQDAAEMRALTTVEHFSEISDEKAKENKACEQYGGCDYFLACKGLRSQDSLQQAMTGVTVSVPSRTSVTPKTLPDPEEKESKMALAKKFGPKSPSPLASPFGESKPAVPAAPATPPAPEAPDPAEEFSPPPWAWHNCTACAGHPGFKRSGDPCTVCNAKALIFNKRAPEQAHPLAENFEIEHQGDGTTMWSNPENGDADIAWSGVNAPPAAVSKAREQSPPPVVEEELAVEEEPAVEEEEAPAVEEEEEAPTAEEEPAPKKARQKKTDIGPAFGPMPSPPEAPSKLVELAEQCVSPGRGRKPKNRFILAINVSVDGASSQVRGDQVFLRLTEIIHSLAVDSGKDVDHFVSLNAFDRRDLITRCAPQVIGSIPAGAVVSVSLGSGSSDLRSFTEALRPYAEMVFEGRD